jgi:hypothetical protein
MPCSIRTDRGVADAPVNFVHSLTVPASLVVRLPTLLVLRARNFYLYALHLSLSRDLFHITRRGTMSYAIIFSERAQD